MVSAAGFAPAIPRSQTERVAPTLRTETPNADFERARVEKHDTENLGTRHRGKILEIGAPGETCTHSLPADNGLLFCSATGAPKSKFEIRNSKIKLVGSAGNAPVRLFRHIFYDARFTVERPDHFPEMVAGTGVAPVEAELMRLA